MEDKVKILSSIFKSGNALPKTHVPVQIIIYLVLESFFQVNCPGFIPPYPFLTKKKRKYPLKQQPHTKDKWFVWSRWTPVPTPLYPKKKKTLDVGLHRHPSGNGPKVIAMTSDPIFPSIFYTTPGQQYFGGSPVSVWRVPWTTLTPSFLCHVDWCY